MQCLVSLGLLQSIGIAENTPEVDGPQVGLAKGGSDGSQVLFIRKIGLDGLLYAWNEACDAMQSERKHRRRHMRMPWSSLASV